jgi:hypothetical protein
MQTKAADRPFTGNLGLSVFINNLQILGDESRVDRSEIIALGTLMQSFRTVTSFPVYIYDALYGGQNQFFSNSS